MVITLFIITSMMVLGGFLDYSLVKVKDKVDVTVYFVTTASETDVFGCTKITRSFA